MEYSDIMADGMESGRMKLVNRKIIFQNAKTEKFHQLEVDQMKLINYERFVNYFGLRILMKNGNFHRYTGLKFGDEKEISKFFKTCGKDWLEKKLSLKGWNGGTVHFNGTILRLDCDKKTSFEIPLKHVSQCTTSKNEVSIEFHPNDNAPVSLMEMRMHTPTESSDSEPIDEFYRSVMKQSSVKTSVLCDSIAIFSEIQCLTPRGRHEIKIFPTLFQLHGKTFDYKIPMSTVLRMFLLPHINNRQMFFVLSLNPPIKQGLTLYYYLVLLFSIEEETSIELKDMYKDKLTKDLSGPVYEVFGKLMKVLSNRKLPGNGSFVGHAGTLAIECSLKAATGYLYPLERGFIFVYPTVHIRFDEIAAVNFARIGDSTGGSRTFDLEIELTIPCQTIHKFNNIKNEEYSELFKFISSMKVHVKNTGKKGKLNQENNLNRPKNDKKKKEKPTAGSLVSQFSPLSTIENHISSALIDLTLTPTTENNFPSPAIKSNVSLPPDENYYSFPSPSFSPPGLSPGYSPASPSSRCSSPTYQFPAFDNKFPSPGEQTFYPVVIPASIPSLMDIFVECPYRKQ